MDETTKNLLAFKHIGTILFNERFIVVDSDPMAKTLMITQSNPLPGTQLLEIFPELIGNENFVRDILNKRIGNFHLDYVNRSDSEGQNYFIHLTVLPVEKPNHGLLLIEDVTDYAKMLQEYNQQKYELLLYKSAATFHKQFLKQSFLGKSEAVQQVRKTIQKLSKVPNATVLLLGETGTGKNLVARVIHYSSMPTDSPFVDINCAALPENLIESELFGYEKGAFTHAMISRQGLFEEAEGGTVFLDEIAELPTNLQAKLLSVLETKSFRRLGSNKSVELDARIIAATNRELQKEVVERRFREDLYYRLNVVSLYLPPLRSLGEDVLIIADHFLKIYNMEFKKLVKGFTEKAQKALLRYAWPGNVRELSNCLERAMIFIEKDLIDENDLVIGNPEQTLKAQKWAIPYTGISLEEIERELIASALEQAGGNKSEAARLLGLTRDTLRYRLEKYKLI